MDLSQLSDEVLGAVRQQLGCDDPDDESNDDQIASMGPVEVLDRYLTWEGIIGYGDTIWSAVENIREAAGLESGES